MAQARQHFTTLAEARADIAYAHSAGMTNTALAIVMDHRDGSFVVTTERQARTWERVPASTRRYWIEEIHAPGQARTRRVSGRTLRAELRRRARAARRQDRDNLGRFAR